MQREKGDCPRYVKEIKLPDVGKKRDKDMIS